MTDEWPFIDQRIPNREVVYRKVDPSQRLEVVDSGDDYFGDLEFSFSSGGDSGGGAALESNQITDSQMLVYPLVDGKSAVSEIILESTLIEFETCKALAELLDKGLIREATQEEVARELRRGTVTTTSRRLSLGSLPWLAIPFLVLLGFSLTIIPRNSVNPAFHLREDLWDRWVEQSLSRVGLDLVAREAEAYYYLNGIYPSSVEEITAGTGESEPVDPWGRPYRLVTRGSKLLVTGADAEGRPVPNLILSRSLAWESGAGRADRSQGPGVQLLD